MWPYWMMYFVAASGVLSPSDLPKRQSVFAFAVVAATFLILIGFRHEVGGDWFTYLPHFDNDKIASISELLTTTDPAYHILDWAAAQLGYDIYAVNVVCAAILMIGTFIFCRGQPNSWLALLVAVPYMLIVVGMGYTRQSAALGFALMGLAALKNNRVVSFTILVALGTLFHKSGILLLPVSALAASKNRVLTAVLVLGTSILLYYLLLEDVAGRLWVNYVEREMESEGGATRVAMNAIPATLMLLFRRQLAPDTTERILWCWMAVLALICVPIVGLASTAVDRVALYLIPIQLFVFSRIPRLAVTSNGRTALVFGIVGYYGAVQYVWLNYASHAQYWLPYQFMPIGGPA